MAAGVREDGLLIDAAQDFGKNTYHSLQVTGQVSALVETGWPVLFAVSNKKFIAETLALNGRKSDRITGTIATTAVGAWEGVRLVRAHDVAQTRQVLDMVAGLRSGIPALARRALA
jgi:dihydropteroate synthase